MISKLSKQFARYLIDNSDEGSLSRFTNQGHDIIELENRLKVILIYILMFPIIIIESTVTDLWIENLISIIMVFGLRILNKGHHFSPDVCLIVTATVILFVPLISELLREGDLLKLNVVIISIIVYIRFPERLNTRNYYKKLISVILCIIGYYFINMLLAAMFALSFDQIKLKRE